MNSENHSIRPAMFIGLLLCLAMFGTALFFQYYMQLAPCPLCIVQRVVVVLLAVIFFFAFIHGPQALGCRVYGLLIVLIGASGVAVAARHIWLQHLPPDKIPECGPGLEFWMSNLPATEVIQKVFQGSGECAEVSWTLFGLSIPQFSLVVFVLFFFYGLKLLIKGR